jgi:hypothetical protein
MEHLRIVAPADPASIGMTVLAHEIRRSDRTTAGGLW